MRQQRCYTRKAFPSPPGSAQARDLYNGLRALPGTALERAQQAQVPLSANKLSLLGPPPNAWAYKVRSKLPLKFSKKRGGGLVASSETCPPGIIWMLK